MDAKFVKNEDRNGDGESEPVSQVLKSPANYRERPGSFCTTATRRNSFQGGVANEIV